VEENLKNKLTYDRYLKVNELISLQKEESNPPHHDEMLFIIIHQVYELWFKQILHETNSVIKSLQSDQIFKVIKALDRIIKIQAVLLKQLDVLETLSPVEFAGFRDHLRPASGFQSHQFRLFEYICGTRDKMYLKFYDHDQKAHKKLQDALATKSLYDEFLTYLSRNGFQIPKEVIERDHSINYEYNEDVKNVILSIYNSHEKEATLYYLLEKLIEFDENLQLWRYRHVKMVERTIGKKMGTGGSEGAQYLRSTLNKSFFPELWECRTEIGTY
jgi:tryptophan 2,3-dioxygenase